MLFGHLKKITFYSHIYIYIYNKFFETFLFATFICANVTESNRLLLDRTLQELVHVKSVYSHYTHILNASYCTNI